MTRSSGSPGTDDLLLGPWVAEQSASSPAVSEEPVQTQTLLQIPHRLEEEDGVPPGS